MVEYLHGLDETFAALADPTRRAILDRLADRPCSVTELAAPFEMSLNAVSKHVKVLERARLVRRQVQGRRHTLHLAAEPLHEADAWVRRYQRFWSARLRALEGLMRSRKRDSRRPNR